MKRILIIFALLSAFALPVQMAEANSFTMSGNLSDQLQIITGKNPSNLFGNLPSSKFFDIAVFYASQEHDPFAGQGNVLSGFNVLANVKANDFFSSVDEVWVSAGGSVAYEYNGASIQLPGGTIFVSASIDNVNYVFAMSLSSEKRFNPVPVPAAAVLFGSGLVGIVALRRKIK